MALGGNNAGLLLFNASVSLLGALLLPLALRRINLTTRQSCPEAKGAVVLHEGWAFVRQVATYRYLDVHFVNPVPVHFCLANM